MDIETRSDFFDYLFVAQTGDVDPCDLTWGSAGDFADGDVGVNVKMLGIELNDTDRWGWRAFVDQNCPGGSSRRDMSSSAFALPFGVHGSRIGVG